MKRKFLAFVLLITAGLSLSSCLSSDDDTNIEYSHDTAITAFSLGNLGQYVKRNTTGKMDSLVASAVTGTNYTFTIDQANRKIYNEDSLPALTRTAAALATISAKNSSYIQLIYDKNVVKEGEDKDSIVWYSSSDSINFDQLNKEKNIRVYAQDASAYADYKVKVNVHTQRPDTFIWQSLTQANAKLAALNSMKAVSAGGKVVLFGKNAAGALEMFKSENGKQWEEIAATANLGNHAVDNIVAFDNALYVLNPETHQLLKSTDAANWTLVGTFASLKQLIGAGSKNLYAYSGNDEGVTGISVSTDKGASWIAEQLDADAKYLPVSNINMSYSAVRSTKDAENVLLIGNRNTTEKTDTIAMVWNRTIDFSGNNFAGSKWNFVEYDNNQPYKMPKLNQLVVAKEDEGYAALGSDANWYESIDGGISWQVDTMVIMPKQTPAFDKTKPFAFVKVKEAAVAPDGTSYDTYIYWLVNGGNVWKGRYNRDGWLRKN
ncbi:MAG: hypothetical protein EGR98_00995 [Prevotella sp.]|nr:hypothetical protein [Prevotella sp.]